MSYKNRGALQVYMCSFGRILGAIAERSASEMASAAFVPEDCEMPPVCPQIGDPFADDFCLDCCEPGIASLPRERVQEEMHNRCWESLDGTLDAEPAILQGLPGCDAGAVFTPGVLSREPTKEMLAPGFEAAAGGLESCDDAVAAEVLRRANDIFQLLVQAGAAHAPREPEVAHKQDGKVLSEVRRLEFEAAVLRGKVQLLNAHSSAGKAQLRRTRGAMIGKTKAPGKARRCKKSSELRVAAVEVL